MNALCYMDWENLDPSSFFNDVMDGGIPPIPPLTSYDVTSHVLIWTIFKGRWLWSESHQKVG